MLVRFQICFMMARSSSLAFSKLPVQNSPANPSTNHKNPTMWICVPSVLILRAVRTRANRVALKVTVPSLFRGMFIPTSRYTRSVVRAPKKRKSKSAKHPRVSITEALVVAYVPCTLLDEDRIYRNQAEAGCAAAK